MKKLLAVLLALALPVAADGPVVCSETPQSPGVACSATTVSTSDCVCAAAEDAEPEPEPSVYDDAVALWKLDETSGTRADSIGSNDLTDNNTVLYANMGPSGTVGDFTAANTEYLSGSGTTAAADSNVTVAAWVRTTGAGNPAIFADGSGNFLLRLSSGVVNLLGRGYADNHNYGSAINDGNWHFVVAYHDADNNLWGVSIDGGSASTNATGGANGAISSITVGKDPVGGYWDDQIGPVGVWTRVLGAEVSSLYNSGSGKSYSDLTTAEKVGLVSYWNLDEASGNRADSHGSNTLTDNNTVGSTTNSYPANLPGTVASFVAANNEYLNSAATPLVSTSTSEWTVAVWVNAASQDAVNTIWSFPGTNQHLLEQRSGAWSEWIGGSQVTVAGADTGAWHLLVGWYDGDKFYLQVDDGTPAESGGGVTADVYNNSAALRIGDRADFAGGFDWNGLLSVGTFWPRVLTSDERAALYNSGAGAVLP